MYLDQKTSETSLSKAQQKPRIYIVDDDRHIGEIISFAGDEVGCETHIICSVQDFKERWNEVVPDIIVLDIIMPDTDGLELLSWLAKKHCAVPVILMSGHDVRHLRSAHHLAEAFKIDVVAALQKPLALTTLETVLAEQLEEILSKRNIRND